MAGATRPNALGDFLRARREQTTPADHGLALGRGRRVPGLRREEVAELAGVSFHYYTRLERGRDRHPSPSVLDALARALNLDAQARAHLDRLAEVRSPGPVEVGSAHGEPVRPELVHLMGQWGDQAALLLGPYRNVLAANALAHALNVNFTLGTNLMREVFLDPAARSTYPDWERVAEEGAAALRASVGAAGHDPERDRLVAELSQGSPEFRRLWDRQEARGKPSGRQRFRTDLVGIIALHYEPFAMPYAPGQVLYVFFAADPDSDDARLLRELSASVAREASG